MISLVIVFVWPESTLFLIHCMISYVFECVCPIEYRLMFYMEVKEEFFSSSWEGSKDATCDCTAFWSAGPHVCLSLFYDELLLIWLLNIRAKWGVSRESARSFISKGLTPKPDNHLPQKDFTLTSTKTAQMVSTECSVIMYFEFFLLSESNILYHHTL